MYSKYFDILIIQMHKPPKEDMYVYVPVQLEDMVNVDNVVSSCICLRNI